MSLILEALKKLERDKQVEGRSGFLVMAARPWPSGGDTRRWWIVGAAGGAVVMMALGAGLALWLGRANTSRAAQGPAAPPAVGPGSASAPAAASSSTSATMPAAPAPVVPAAAAPGRSLPVVAAPLPAVSPETADLRPPAANPTAAVATAEPAPMAEPAEPRAPLQVIPPALTGAARFRLTAISERDGKPVAMINDRLVMEGDRFDDVTVVRIGTGEVELSVAGKPLTVRF